MEVEVYTDGSATTADKCGGYGYVIVIDGKKHAEGSGYMEKASNNDAELMASIEGLAYVKNKILTEQYLMAIPHYSIPKVTLVSDSQITLGWANGTYVFRQESKMEKFKELQYLIKTMNVQTKWVKGHSGNEHNERCDKLANAARLKQDVDSVKEKKKKVAPVIQGNFASITFRIVIDKEMVHGFVQESISLASISPFPVYSDDWNNIVIDKLKDLMDNNKYFKVEKD